MNITRCEWCTNSRVSVISFFITVCNEVAKVMFSQACVCPQGGSASVHAGKEAPPQQGCLSASWEGSTLPPGRMPQCILGRKHPPQEGCLSACWEGSTPPKKDASVHPGKEAPPHPRRMPQCMLGRKHTPKEGCLSASWGRKHPPHPRRMPQCMLGRKHPPRERRLLLRTVRILLECILV